MCPRARGLALRLGWAGGACAFLIATAGAAAEVRVVGSDLLGSEVTRALYAFSGQAGLPLAVALDGSRPGLEQLKAGRADLALVVVGPGQEAALADFASDVLAYHCVFVLVTAEVPWVRTTLGQLRAIFGENGSENISRWGEAGLRDELAASAIVPLAPAVGQGIAGEFFRQLVLGGRPFRSTVERYVATGDLAARMAGDRRVLALSPQRPSAASALSVVPVAAHAGDPAYSPTAENLRSGDYPLGLPLRVVVRREAAPALRPLLAFLFSDEFAAKLELAGLVPLPAAARGQHAVLMAGP